MKRFKLIIITGKRWFQRSCGNTYHSVTVEIRHAKKDTIYLKSGIHYGYNDQYRQTACDMLIKAGYIKNWHEFCELTRNNRDKFVFNVSDVSREKDLK